MQLEALKLMDSKYEDISKFIDDLFNKFLGEIECIKAKQKNTNKIMCKENDEESNLIFLNLLWLYGYLSPKILLKKGRYEIEGRYFFDLEEYKKNKEHIDDSEHYVSFSKTNIKLLNTKFEEKKNEYDTILVICKRSKNLNVYNETYDDKEIEYNFNQYLNNCLIYTLSDFFHKKEMKLIVNDDAFIYQNKEKLVKYFILPINYPSYYMKEKIFKKIRYKYQTYLQFSALSNITVKERISLYEKAKDQLIKIMKNYMLMKTDYEVSKSVIEEVLNTINHPFYTDLLLIKKGVNEVANILVREMKTLYICSMNSINIHSERGSLIPERQKGFKKAVNNLKETENSHGDLKFIFNIMSKADEGNPAIIEIVRQMLLDYLYNDINKLTYDIDWTTILKKGAVANILLLDKFIDDLNLIDEGKLRKYRYLNIDDCIQECLCKNGPLLTQLQEITVDRESQDIIKHFINIRCNNENWKENRSNNLNKYAESLHKYMMEFYKEFPLERKVKSSILNFVKNEMEMIYNNLQ